MSILAYGNQNPEAPLEPITIQRRELNDTDVEIEILFCGICHSDLHQARDEWGGTLYPCVPGHEIVGRVTAVGSAVSEFDHGDHVGVGCMVDSCQECESCRDHHEQFCYKGAVMTYNGTDHHLGGHTFGGYSQKIVVDKEFVLRVRDTENLAAVAPLLCAGITTYSPLKRWGVGPGQKVGVIGLGGLGHMGLKIACAMGARVTLFTTSPSKVDDARRLGAHEVVISKDKEQMAKARGFDLILNTVSANIDLNTYIGALKPHGVLVQVGAPQTPLEILPFSIIGGSKALAGSLIGGIKETQEMLDFCADHKITADIEMIEIDEVNEAYERMLKSDVKYRFVIDMASLKE